MEFNEGSYKPAKESDNEKDASFNLPAEETASPKSDNFLTEAHTETKRRAQSYKERMREKYEEMIRMLEEGRLEIGNSTLIGLADISSTSKQQEKLEEIIEHFKEYCRELESECMQELQSTIIGRYRQALQTTRTEKLEASITQEGRRELREEEESLELKLQKRGNQIIRKS